MNKDTIITYIKDGKEKTVKLNKLNKERTLNKIFYTRLISNEYKIREEISYLEIKNKEFEPNTIFSCFYNQTMVVLDNCKFDGLRLEGCSYQIIEPIFNRNFGSIKGEEIQDLIIDISPTHLQNININISFSENFTLNGNYNYYGNLNLINLENILINNVKMYPDDDRSSLYVRNSNLKINNSTINSLFIKGYSLELINTMINSKSELQVLYMQIKGRNYAFKTEGSLITLTHNKYYNTNCLDTLVIKDEDLLNPKSNLVKATNMIAFLESLKEKVLELNKEEAKYLENKLMRKRIKSYDELKK